MGHKTQVRGQGGLLQDAGPSDHPSGLQEKGDGLLCSLGGPFRLETLSLQPPAQLACPSRPRPACLFLLLGSALLMKNFFLLCLGLCSVLRRLGCGSELAKRPFTGPCDHQNFHRTRLSG